MDRGSELQRGLVHGTASELSDAGGVRDRIVVVGARGRGFEDARFVPSPPGDQLRAGVEDLLDWVNKPPSLPTVVVAAMTHYQFESLHPFSDGNGRIGRLLVIVQLLRDALIREPLLVVSPWFEQHRDQYQSALLELSLDGRWDPWVTFFAEGVAASAAASQRKVEHLVSLQESLRATVQQARKRGAAERIAADLIGDPFVTGPDVAGRYDLSLQGALNAIRTLISLGILDPAPERLTRHGAQLYRSPPVLDVLLS